MRDRTEAVLTALLIVVTIALVVLLGLQVARG
jgi:hypothetical protein